MKETPEQLKELIGQFHDPRQARQMAEEMQQVETQIGSFPAPAMRAEAVRRIKNRVTAHPVHPGVRIWQASVAAAACLTVVSALFFITHRSEPTAAGPRLLPLASIEPWEDELLTDGDVTDTIAGELDEITDQIQDLQASQWDQPEVWQQDIFELEDSDLITSTSFWKG